MGFLKAMFDGEYGLVWSNVGAYFTSRKRGATHPEALEAMVRTRYPREPTKRDLLLSSVSEVGGTEEEQLRSVISRMLAVEAGIPRDLEPQLQRGRYMDEIIAIHKRKSPRVL